MSEYRTLWIKAISETKERRKIIGEGTVTKPNQYEVDAPKLADQIAEACNAAEADGYDIISIIPIDRGREHMGEFAYSITDGVILTARKKKTGT